MAFWQRWTSRARAFILLDGPRRLLGLEAVVLMPVGSMWLRLGGLGRMQRAIVSRTDHRQTGRVEEHLTATLVLAVESAARVWHANCLRRSVTLWWMMRRRGLDPQLRIGVRSTDQTPAFHAWLELDGRVLNDADDVAAHYTPFDRSATPPNARFE